MRIISGKLRGKKINPPKNIKARPTTDFAKESLFNILNNIIDFEDKSVLDLFSGTGNISYEFISRGVQDVTAVDSDFTSYKFMSTFVKDAGIDNMKVVKASAFQVLKTLTKSYDIVFADPPYAHKRMLELPELILENNVVTENGLLIIEHDRNTNFSDNKYFDSTRDYGKVHFSFFTLK